MGTPATRTPLRVARGTYANLNASKADILEGEICYAHDQNKLYVKEGSNLEENTVADSTKLPLAGGTLTGALTLSGDPTATNHAANKNYTDTQDALKLSLAGGTMTGAIILAGNPTASTHAANKSYVDTQALAGGVFTGDVFFNSNKIDFSGTGGLVWDTDDGNTYEISLTAPSTLTASAAYVWPAADGSTGQALTTNGSGQWSWTSVGDAKKADDNNWTGAQRGSVSTLTYGSAVTIDMDTTNNHKITLTGGQAMTFNNPTNCDADAIGQSGSIFIIQDGTGSGTAAWGTSGSTSSWHWKGGTAPTLSTAANAVDRIDYIVYDANKIHAVATIGISANT